MPQRRRRRRQRGWSGPTRHYRGRHKRIIIHWLVHLFQLMRSLSRLPDRPILVPKSDYGNHYHTTTTTTKSLLRHHPSLSTQSATRSSIHLGSSTCLLAESKVKKPINSFITFPWQYYKFTSRAMQFSWLFRVGFVKFNKCALTLYNWTVA